LEDFLTYSGEEDEFSEHYKKKVKPSTVALRRQQLRELASALAVSGFPAEQIVDLSVLVVPDNALAALRYKRDRPGGAREDGKVKGFLMQQAWLLCTIARHWVKNPDHDRRLRNVVSKWEAAPKGMTKRNEARLKQFDLKSNVSALMQLSAKVSREVKAAGAISGKDAQRMTMVTAVELLIVAPMRVGNLAALDLDRHIIQVGKGRDRICYLDVPAQEVKNSEAVEAMLPAGSRDLLEAYVSTYRNVICPGPSPFLFPNASGGARNTIAFSRSITQFIEKETGVTMHAHLFRQLAGKLHIARSPQDLETIRRILGHKNVATTAKYYVKQETEQAFRRYDETLQALRNVDAIGPIPRAKSLGKPRAGGGRAVTPTRGKPSGRPSVGSGVKS